jgi:hypothetical protein
MKTKSALIVLSLFFISLSGCKNPEGEKTKAEEAKDVSKEQTSDMKKIDVNTESSVIHWTGTKPTGEHHGTLQIKDGHILLKDGKIYGGKVIMDMTSIKNEDIEKEDMRQKLVGHLKSKDFFDVENYKESAFEITNVEKIGENEFSHKISGNLDIKDISKNISFKINVNMEGDKIKVKSEKFLIDRTNWDINYKSKSVFDNLKEQFIHDDVGIEFKLAAKK